jgi:hypothetical protein
LESKAIFAFLNSRGRLPRKTKIHTILKEGDELLIQPVGSYPKRDFGEGFCRVMVIEVGHSYSGPPIFKLAGVDYWCNTCEEDLSWFGMFGVKIIAKLL